MCEFALYIDSNNSIYIYIYICIYVYIYIYIYIYEKLKYVMFDTFYKIA